MQTSPLSPMLFITQQLVEALAASPAVAALLLKQPQENMDNEEAPALVGTYIFDYMPVTPQDSPAVDTLIGVETELLGQPTAAIQEWQVRLGIWVKKSAMLVDEESTGFAANRRDRLAEEADKLLSGSRQFGIGVLLPDSCYAVEAPAGFTGRETIYRFSRTVTVPSKR